MEVATTPLLTFGLWRSTLPPGKVVPPSFLPQNERKRWINNYLQALDLIGLYLGATGKIR